MIEKRSEFQEVGERNNEAFELRFVGGKGTDLYYKLVYQLSVDEGKKKLLSPSRRLLPLSTLSWYTSLSSAAPTQLSSSLKSWHYTDFYYICHDQTWRLLYASKD